VSAAADGATRDLEAVAMRLGRVPSGPFEVVVRDRSGGPAVIQNAPFLTDGTPMPTMFWLVDPELCRIVGRLESMGGVRRAEATLSAEVIADAHRRHADQRCQLVPTSHRGPVPTGGVGGTRRGVKCLHAHLAWWLAGGDDPVGAWTAAELGIDGPRAPTTPRPVGTGIGTGIARPVW